MYLISRHFPFELVHSTELFTEDFAAFAGSGDGEKVIPIPVNKNEFYHGKVKGAFHILANNRKKIVSIYLML